METNGNSTSLNELDPQHKLFEELKSTAPAWWQFVKENIKPDGFYVDVRKDNTLNVYYNGGSVLKLTFPKRENRIKGTIHESYLGRTGSDYKLPHLPADADSIKKKIALNSKYSYTSENGIKARLISSHGANYIDSEFAFSEIVGKTVNGKGEGTRIDLTKIEDGKIIFVELKRIQDGRLLTKEYENGNPEILRQMKEYNQFTKKHKQEIIDYYKTLFKIKRDLEILPPGLEDINDLDGYDLSENVELYIEPYAELNKKRSRRIDAIKTILNRHNIVHNL
jgi:hypothetical protein